ncbi:MAG: sulfite exporter TauE/SafE family protein [Bacteroidales bacterium]|nr:sulfite exporter TauE/SafE family protein [Bacteroidales bacterium]
MEYILIALVAFGAAMLTFFSGFGLGTILLPVFAIFFPVEIAIAMTAIVHLINNLFKMSLIWQAVNLKVAALFAIPAALFAIGGALLLNYLSSDDALFTYHLGNKEFEVTLIKLIIGLLLIIFAIIEIDKRFDKLALPRKYLPIGGALSGFFGGLSGHQGALRSLFLLRAGLGKEGFIATGIAAAIVIDISRLSIYGTSFFSKHFAAISNDNSVWMVVVATLAAFAGSFIGRRMLKKVTMRTVQLSVGFLILVMGVLLGSGII